MTDELSRGELFEMALDLLPSTVEGLSGFTGEDVRMVLEDVLGPAHDPHVWGSIIAAALNRGIIVRTGSDRAMRSPAAKWRRTPVYRLPDEGDHPAPTWC